MKSRAHVINDMVENMLKEERVRLQNEINQKKEELQRLVADVMQRFWAATELGRDSTFDGTNHHIELYLKDIELRMINIQELCVVEFNLTVAWDCLTDTGNKKNWGKGVLTVPFENFKDIH